MIESDAVILHCGSSAKFDGGGLNLEEQESDSYCIG